MNKKLPVDTIRISCDGAPGPGLAWTIIVEFRPLRRGYSVWAYENNVMTDRPQWRKVEGSLSPLTWRTAYQSLTENDNLRVFGDFWFETSIEGLPKWAANILRLVFIIDEEGPSDYRCLGDLLFGFSDEEILSVIPETGLNPFAKPFDEDDPSDFQKLASLASSAVTAGLIGHSLQEIRSKLGIDGGAALDDLVSMLSDKADEIKHAIEQQHISEFINKKKEQDVPNGIVDHDYQSIGYSRLREWEVLSQGPLPDDLDKHIDLITCWLSEAEKPRGGYSVKGIHEGSEWPILMWLLDIKGIRHPMILAELLRQRPEEARLLANEVMRRGKKEAYYFEGPNRFSGWAQNVIGKHIHRAHVEFALRFQTAADSLGIAIDKQYRIGEVPYLSPRPASQ